MAEYRLTPMAQRDLDGVFDYTVTHWGLSQDGETALRSLALAAPTGPDHDEAFTASSQREPGRT